MEQKSNVQYRAEKTKTAVKNSSFCYARLFQM